MGLSLNEAFEMDLWQFVCYMEGYNSKLARTEMSNIALAVRTGNYTGQYFTGKRTSDPKKELQELEDVASFNRYKDTKKISDEEKLERLKKTMKYFK